MATKLTKNGLVVGLIIENVKEEPKKVEDEKIVETPADKPKKTTKK